MARIEDIEGRVVIDDSQYQQRMAAVRRTLDQTSSSFQSFSSSIANAMAALGGITVVRSLLSAASYTEGIAIGMQTLTGEARRAQDMLRELRDFAARTPFEFKGLIQSAQRLQAFGFQAREIVPVLTRVGDAAAALGGSSELIDRITLALGQMRAAGRVTAQDMRQLAQAGLPAWEMLAKSVGMSVAETMKAAEKGVIDAEQAIDAILRGMEGRFGGLMQRQSKTIAGMLSNLRDQLFYVMEGLGSALVPAAKTVVERVLVPIMGALTELVKRFQELPPVTRSVVSSLMAIGTAVPIVVAGIQALNAALGINLVASLASAARGLWTVVYAIRTGLMGALLASEITILKWGGAVAVVAAGLYGLVRAVSLIERTIAALPASVRQNETAYDSLAGSINRATKASQSLRSEIQQTTGRPWWTLMGGPEAPVMDVEPLRQALRTAMDETRRAAAVIRDAMPSALRITAEYAETLRQKVERDARRMAEAHEQAAKQIKDAFSALGITDYATKIKEAEAALALLGASGKVTAEQLAAARSALSRLRAEAEEFAKNFRNIDASISSLATSAAFVESAAALRALSQSIQSLDVGQPFSEAVLPVKALHDAITGIIAIAPAVKTALALPPSVVEPVDTLRNAFKRLGLTMQSELRSAAATARYAMEQVARAVARGAAEPRDLLRAIVAYQDALRRTGDIAVTSARTQKQALQEVSTVLTNLNQSIAEAIVNWKGFGNAVVTILKRIAVAILADLLQSIVFTEQRIKKLVDAIARVLSKLPGLGKIFGTISQRIPAPQPRVPAPVPGGAAGGGGVAGGAAAGAAGLVNVALSAVNAAFSALQFFQSRAQGRTFDLIERESRETKIITLDTLNAANQWWPWMKETALAVWRVREVLIDPVARLLGEIAMRGMPGGQQGSGATTPAQVTINVNGVQDPDKIARELVRLLKLYGIVPSTAPAAG